MAFQESELDGFVATEVRIVASLVLLLPFGLITKRYYSPIRMFRENNRACWLTALGSVLGPFLGISFSLIAIKHTKVGIAATIMARCGFSSDVVNECLNHMQSDRMARVYIQDRREAEQARAFDALGAYLERTTSSKAAADNLVVLTGCAA